MNAARYRRIIHYIILIMFSSKNHFHLTGREWSIFIWGVGEVEHRIESTKFLAHK